MLRGERCITGEKWFASGDSNVFRLSSTEVDSLFIIIMGYEHP
jgi:hypothetical protein